MISTPNQLQGFLYKDSQGEKYKEPFFDTLLSICLDHYKPKNMNLGDYAGKCVMISKYELSSVV